MRSTGPALTAAGSEQPGAIAPEVTPSDSTPGASASRVSRVGASSSRSPGTKRNVVRSAGVSRSDRAITSTKTNQTHNKNTTTKTNHTTTTNKPNNRVIST